MTSIALLLYFCLLIAVGWRLRGRARDAAGAYLAHRRLGAGLVGVSLAATALGGTATVVLARHVHAHGLAGVWLDLPLGLGLIVFALVLAGRVRESGRFSLAELAGELVGPHLRVAIGWLVVVAEIAWFALLVRAATAFLGELVPWPDAALVTLLAGTFVAYTALGGQAAVAWTDGVQLLLLGVLGLLVPAGIVLWQTGGLQGLPEGALDFPVGGGLDSLDVLGLVALVGLPALVGGDIYSKTLSARDVRAARRGALIAAGLKLLATLCVVILALGALVLLPDLPTGNDILPATLRAVLPPWLAPFVLLAFLAAFMSTADSVLLTGATVLDVDLLPPARRAAWQARRPRMFILGLGVVGTIVALSHDDIVALMRWAYTVFVAGAPIPVLAGFAFRRRLSDTAACAALATGGAVAVGLMLAGVTRPAPVLWGLGASAAVLVAGAARCAVRQAALRAARSAR